jgi:signal transduction protein with GAF and PtsI domain
MDNKELEDMRRIFIDDNLERRILELIDSGKKAEEIVDTIIKEFKDLNAN